MDLSKHAAHFDAFGFALLQRFADVEALSTEFDTCMKDASADPNHMNSGAAGNQFRYVPTMCERTPHSLALLRQLGPVASDPRWYVTEEQRSRPGCIGCENDRLSHSRALSAARRSFRDQRAVSAWREARGYCGIELSRPYRRLSKVPTQASTLLLTGAG